MKNTLQIGALISGSGTNLQAVIDACENAAIDGRVVFVGSDNPVAGGLKRAQKHGIDTFAVDYPALIAAYRAHPEGLVLPADFDLGRIAAQQSLLDPSVDWQRLKLFLESRALAEAELLRRMAAYPFDLLILAGFMRTLSPYFIDRVNTPGRPIPRIMNIHPALLPAFPGVDGYGDTYRYGCKVAGCTVHFVDYGEDTGPIIGQKAFPIEAGDSLEKVRKNGLFLEWQLYPECIQLFAQNRLRLVTRRHELKSGKTVERKVVEVLPQKS